MTSLFALCRPSNGPVTVKRVQISQPVQNTISGLFQQQATDFLDGIDEEVPFGGDYKPDADEILVLDAPNETALMQAAVANPIGLETIGAANFVNEYIKGLFISVGDGEGGPRLLIQAFTAQQFLGRDRLALIFDGNVFRQVTEPSFALDHKLVALAENGRLKFKSFHFLKRIFPLEDVYREATDQQIGAFCGHASLLVEDLDAVKTSSNQIIRRLIHAVQTANVLDQSSVSDIQAKAEALGLDLTVDNGRLVLPADRQRLKEFLKFLDDSIYEGPLSAQRLVASSKRPFAAR